MFDPTKVQFDSKELDAAKAADDMYEVIRDQLEDGFQVADLVPILTASVGPVATLFGYLKSDSPQEYADKLIALGVMLERDNDWLEGL